MYECHMCHKKFDGRKKKYCSNECAKYARRLQNKENYRKANSLYEKYEEQRCCKQCGKDISDKSLDAVYCNDGCRQTYYDRLKGHVPMEEHLKSLAEQKRETEKRRKITKEQAYAERLVSKNCVWCSRVFTTDIANKLTCSNECRRKRTNKIKSDRDSNRLNKSNLVDRDISVVRLYKRDKGICYLCGEQCNPNDYNTTGGHFTSGPTYPSIDHIIPLARGGMHAWDNVRLAHHLCNAKKTDILPCELGIDLHVPDAYALARNIPDKKKVTAQYTKQGELIAVFNSTVDAEKKTGIPKKTIQNNARGQYKTAHGFVFKYISK